MLTNIYIPHTVRYLIVIFLLVMTVNGIVNIVQAFVQPGPLVLHSRHDYTQPPPLPTEASQASDETPALERLEAEGLTPKE